MKVIVVGMLVTVMGGQTLLEPGAGMAPRTDMPLRLSEYHIFTGRAGDLRPSNGFTVYELANTLFTDYAEKQRLIGLPVGGRLRVTGDGLPVFPDGTMLVKTFYYYFDKRDTVQGRRLIETRVMVLSGGQWRWGTYLWNADGTEALLSASSSRINVEWKDERGLDRRIRYVVPSHADCATCHKRTGGSLPGDIDSAGKFMPIGPTVRNLRLGAAFTSTMPAWQDSSHTLAQRVSAYLEVNCAHCHHPDGYCAKAGLDLRWGAALPDRKEVRKMVRFMRNGRMPLTGTTIVHREGLALVEEYLQSLPNK